MSAAHGTEKPDRTQILREARIVTAADVGSSPQLASQLALANICSKLCGREFYVVLWPNGITAMVVAEPGTTEWADLLVTTFEGGLQNRIGPVVLGG